MTNAADYAFMARALRLAERGIYSADPNPRVGCVLVRDGEIVGEGWHCRAGEPHAEVHALRQAGERARGADVYVTLEPCLMCAGALVLARITRLVYGCRDPKAGALGSVYDVVRDNRLNHVYRITPGVLETECRELLTSFFEKLRMK